MLEAIEIIFDPDKLSYVLLLPDSTDHTLGGLDTLIAIFNTATKETSIRLYACTIAEVSSVRDLAWQSDY